MLRLGFVSSVRSLHTSHACQRTFYEVLGVPVNATQREIKAAYFEKSKKLHPDLKSGDPKLFVELNEAYSVLKEPNSRRDYDAQLAGPAFRPRYSGDYGAWSTNSNVYRDPMNFKNYAGARPEKAYTAKDYERVWQEYARVRERYGGGPFDFMGKPSTGSSEWEEYERKRRERWRQFSGRYPFGAPDRAFSHGRQTREQWEESVKRSREAFKKMLIVYATVAFLIAAGKVLLFDGMQQRQNVEDSSRKGHEYDRMIYKPPPSPLGRTEIGGGSGFGVTPAEIAPHRDVPRGF